MSHLSVLGSDGAIARKLPNYEIRPEQLQMAQAVADAIAQRQHLMVEAGTGVGKSFAYLVPAIQAAARREDFRIVISTHTISLQEQLVRKDIPFLQSVMSDGFKAVLVKGRGNYLSLRRLRVANQKRPGLLADFEMDRDLDRIADWARSTRDGSRSDLEFRPLPSVWDLVASDSGNCLGKKCADFDRCFYFKARVQMHDAEILIVNHALLFCDLALRQQNKDHGLLPQYHVAILDEAHTVEDVASEHLGLRVTRGQIEFLLNRLYVHRGDTGFGLLVTQGSNDAMRQVQEVRSAADVFFRSIMAWHELERRPAAQGGGDSARVRRPGIVPDPLSRSLRQLADLLTRDGTAIKNEEQQIEYMAVANRCRVLADQIEAWLKQKLGEQVYWIDVTNRKRASLASAPIDVAPILRQILFEKVPSVILVSATLNVGGGAGFDHFQKRLGFPSGQPTLQLGSPFDYRKQAELYLFPSMPDPGKNSDEFERASVVKIRDFVLLTGGRAFVLFTSNQAMDRAAAALRGWLKQNGIQMLCQSDGLPPARMIEQFKRQPRTVLFGVASFWQGVDVPGDALSNVIIAKLPFSPPDRPVIEARAEAIERTGGNAFHDYQVPQAIIRLKQGFGRLIRTRSDHGMVVILDPRVMTKSYGRLFLDALPDCRRYVDGVAVN
jgi:ATP-dependent DNA helicase DinG